MTTVFLKLVRHGQLVEVSQRIVCHLCGALVCVVKTHLRQAHGGMSADEYRRRFGIPADVELVSTLHLANLDSPLRVWSERQRRNSTVRIGGSPIR